MKEWQPLLTGVVIAIGIVVAATIHSLGGRYMLKAIELNQDSLAGSRTSTIVLDRLTGTIFYPFNRTTIKFGEERVTTSAN